MNKHSSIREYATCQNDRVRPRVLSRADTIAAAKYVVRTNGEAQFWHRAVLVGKASLAYGTAPKVGKHSKEEGIGAGSSLANGCTGGAARRRSWPGLKELWSGNNTAFLGTFEIAFPANNVYNQERCCIQDVVNGHVSARNDRVALQDGLLDRTTADDKVWPAYGRY
jgi:hypothetical protein